MAKQYLIAIDGGGTNTEVVVFDRFLNIQEKLITGSTNINQINNDKFQRTMNKLICEIEKYDNAQIILGIPGYGQSSDIDSFLDLYFAQNIDSSKYDYTVVNDGNLAHYASLGLADGILIIAGTGSMALEIKNGVSQRVGGWGHLIGDEGSGFKIGYAAMNHVIKVFDGLEQSSLLSNLICQRNKFDFGSKIFRYIYSSPDYRIAISSLSSLVDIAANQGCPVANTILEQAALQLVDQVKVLIDGQEPKVSYCGGVFNSKTIKNLVKSELTGITDYNDPILMPVLGGVLYLIEKDKRSNFCIEHLKSEYANIEWRRI